MSEALDRLDRMHREVTARLDAIEQLLQRHTGQQVSTAGGVTIRDGIPFSPGTGSLGGPDLSHANCTLCDGHGNQFNTDGEWAGHCQGATT